jgi:hypothetical protein
VMASTPRKYGLSRNPAPHGKGQLVSI